VPPRPLLANGAILRARSGSAPRLVEGAGAAESGDLHAGSAVSMRHELQRRACPIGRFWPSARRPRVCQQKHNVGKRAQLGLVGLCAPRTSATRLSGVSLLANTCTEACRAVSKSQRETGSAAKHSDKWHHSPQPPCANGKQQ